MNNYTPCPGCNGTGQMTWFGGVSRFQFSYDDCPECNGTGFLDPPPENTLQPEQIASGSGLSQPQLERFLQLLAQILSETLLHGEAVQLRGFGTFQMASSTQDKKQLTFTPGLQLRKALNDSKQ